MSGSGLLSYEHPVLWSGERKRLEQRLIAEESVKLARIKKERERREQRRDQEEVRSSRDTYRRNGQCRA